MKVMLVFPPQWIPAMPHLALPTLTSFLRSHGVDVIQRDLNVETYDMILTRAYLQKAMDRLSTRLRRGRSVPERVRWAWREGPRLADQVEAAKAVFRSPAFYDGEKSLDALLVIGQALELVSLPYYPALFDLVNFQPAVSVDSSRGLLQAACDHERNMLLPIFRRVIIPDLVRQQPDIVGISVPTRGQMLAAVTLAYLIKETGLSCHVTAGGPHITMVREQLPRVPALFELFDSAVLFDGEMPLLRLAEALDGHGGLAGVPNLVYRSDGQVRVNDRPLKPPSDTGPHPRPPFQGERGGAKPAEAGWPGLPDFDGLPLDRYLVPELVLPLITAHGCYHGECAFCNVGYGTGKGFHALPVEQVLAQIRALRQKYGVRHIFFADEAIPPRTLRRLSAALSEEGSPVAWCGCARFEPGLSEKLLESMAAGGCRMLLFGLETGSERMIRHMVKGTCPEIMSRVLRASAKAGIWNHAFFFFGFPTETMADAQETVNFLYAHQDAVHSASPGVFMLERYSPVHADPARFGVRGVVEVADQDLAITFDYEVESGLDEEMARTLYERLLDVLPTKRYGQYYLHDVNRFLYASHLHDQGRPFPLWLADEAAKT
ncbi:MAG: radical SAM protein [Anaerolineae bacterium]|nr:radical SAM protein [Anaerolineae bacterium]